MFYLFTYGTLKKGFVNDYILESQEFIAKMTLSGAYLKEVTSEMTDVYPFPVLFADGNVDHKVEGEVYYCQDELLPYLDSLEGEGELYYRCAFEFDNEDTTENCYIYVGIEEVWKDYDLKECNSMSWESK